MNYDRNVERTVQMCSVPLATRCKFYNEKHPKAGTHPVPCGKKRLSVKGGVKPGQQGGAKIDHCCWWKSLICEVRQGWLERRSAPPLGGAFRPERKALLPIAAAWGGGEEQKYIRLAGFWGR